MKGFAINWGWAIEVHVVTSLNDFEKVYWGPKDDWLAGGRAKFCAISNDLTGKIILCLPNAHPRTNRLTSEIVHECLHVLHFMLKHHRAEHERFWKESAENDLQMGFNEMEAHMLQTIVQNVLDILDEEQT